MGLSIEDKRLDLRNEYNEKGCRVWSDVEVAKMDDHEVEVAWANRGFGGDFNDIIEEYDRVAAGDFEAAAWFLGGLVVGMLIVGLVSYIL